MSKAYYVKCKNYKIMSFQLLIPFIFKWIADPRITFT